MIVRLSEGVSLRCEKTKPGASPEWTLDVNGEKYGADALVTAKSGKIQARIFARMNAAASNEASKANVRKALKEFGGQGR